MKFNFLFLSYSVIYAKYNYCYDVPTDMPTRYFDAPNILNMITKELDWADLIKEMKEIELVETAPKVTESTFAVKKTKTTSKKSVTKTAATPKLTQKILKRPTQPATIKTTVYHNPNTCKLQFTTTTKKCADIWEKKNIEKLKDWKNMWSFLTPTSKSATLTTKINYAKTTKQCPTIRPTKQIVTTKMPAKLSGAQGEGRNVMENWSKLLKEFLKFVELKKCKPPCDSETATRDNLYLLADNRRAMTHDDDLMNILMDGVEVDDRLSEDDDVTSQRELVPFKETLEDQSQILDFEPDEGSIIDYEQQFSGDNVQNGEVKSSEDTIRAIKKQQDKTAPTRKKMSYLTKFKANKAKKDYEVSPIRRSEIYLDKLNDKCTKKSDEIVKSSEIKSYFEALQNKHKKENDLSKDKGMKASLDDENDSQSRKEQDKDIRNHINDNDLYGQNDENSLLEFSKDISNSKDLYEITDDMATKHTDSREIKSQTNDEDVYQDRDITFDIEALESDDVGTDQYSTESSLVQGGELEYDGEAVNGINEQKDDITMKSHKNINLVEF